MNKYLSLEFKNAGLFPLRNFKGKLTKDKIFDINGRRDREYEFVEPITVHQVSNMLHVLFGERPKPTHRFTVYGKNDYLYNKALDSYLKITSYKNDKGQYPTQTVQTKKAVGNAWSPIPIIYWERVKKYLGDSYQIFHDVIAGVFGSEVFDKRFTELIPRLKESKDPRINEAFTHLNSKGLSALYSYIFLDKRTSDMSQSQSVRLTVVTGVDTIKRLDGRLLIPVSDEDILKIKANKGCATILDEGLVMIRGLKNANSLNISEYTKVGDISLDIKN